MKQMVGRAVLAVCVAAGVAAGAAGDQTFGAGVKTKDATSIRDLYATPEKFLGKTIRIDGLVTAVCEEMGCWVALAAEGQPEQTVRFKAEDGKGIVFPLSAKGKKASAEGVFEKIVRTDTDAHHAAQAQAGSGASHSAHQTASTHTGHDVSPADFGRTYHVKVTGAVIK
jgi:hypothetical protein